MTTRKPDDPAEDLSQEDRPKTSLDVSPEGSPHVLRDIPDEPEVPLSEALRQASRTRRRSLLKGLGAIVVVGALGGGALLVVERRKQKSDAEAAVARSKQVDEALVRGDLRAAKKLADEARALDPVGAEAALAFLRVSAFMAIDGDGTPADSVELLANARKLGARGADLAFLSLAAAVGIKNDRLAERILKEQEEAELAPDARYAYAAGAACDLLCDDQAIGHYALAQGFYLAKVRRARALLFATRIDEARKAITELPQERHEAKILSLLADRVAIFSGAPDAKAPWVDPSWATELPKSLRVIATAMALGDPNSAAGQSAGLDAALDDTDSPLAALLAGRIALAAGDKVSAKAASACAIRMREELGDAKVFAARLALVDGDLARAKELAGAGPDKEMVLEIQAIESYERADKTRLSEIDKESQGVATRFWGLATARGLLGDGPAPTQSALDEAIAKNLPWADLFAVDAALAGHDLDRAKKLALAWSEGPLSDARKLRKERL